MDLLRVETLQLRKFLIKHEKDIAQEGRMGDEWGQLYLVFNRVVGRWPVMGGDTQPEES